MKKIILIHGYNRDHNDMTTLKDNLEELGYEIILVDLPLTFKRIEYCTDIFKREVQEIISRLPKEEKISLVGHSTGGLIIRNFLTITQHKGKIDKCVLIGTPNKGSKLADIAAKVANIFVDIFKTLKSLRTKNIERLNLYAGTEIEIGAIAGNKNNLLLGNLLKRENDGRVRVDSVKYDNLKDFIVLPYGHKEIHYKFETAKLIDNFLKYKKFK